MQQIKTEKPWGYEILWAKTDKYVGKIIKINNGKRLSLQSHNHRSEHWIVADGQCHIESMMQSSMLGDYYLPIQDLEKHEQADIFKTQWHKLSNPFDEPCHIIEIQYGDKCEEEDIERR